MAQYMSLDDFGDMGVYIIYFKKPSERKWVRAKKNYGNEQLANKHSEEFKKQGYQTKIKRTE